MKQNNKVVTQNNKDVKQNIKSWKYIIFLGGEWRRAVGMVETIFRSASQFWNSSWDPYPIADQICDFPYPISDLNPDNTVGVNIKREMILSPNDEEVECTNHTLFQTKVVKTDTLFRTKTATPLSLFLLD